MMKFGVTSLVVLSLGCATAKPATRGLPGGDGPLALSLKRQAGGATFSLAQERGQVVLLDVWATWCDPCRQSLPLYQELLAKLKAKGLRVYAISVDADLAEIPKFVTETGLTLPILLDPSAAYAESILKVSVMPTAFLVDRKGRVRHVHEGFTDESLALVTQQVEALLAEP